MWGPPAVVERVALAYGGVGVACLALWLLASASGLSRWTSVGAPLIGIERDVVAFGIGGGEAIHAAGAGQALTDDAIEQGVGLGENLLFGVMLNDTRCRLRVV